MSSKSETFINNEATSRWTRKLSKYETLMHGCYLKQFMIIRYAIVLNAKEEISEDVFTLALEHLYKKVPTLRLCLGYRQNGDLWFRQMNGMKLLFEMVEQKRYDQVYRDALQYNFNIHEGPLWCVKVSPSSKECSMPEIKKDYPHQYNLLFVFNHCITDGTSNVPICNLYLGILNDIMASKTIDDGEQLGYHASEDEWEEVKSSIANEMQIDSPRYKKVKEYLSIGDAAPNYLREATPFTSLKQCIESIHYDFSIQQTKRIAVVSKSHGVTINSFMSAAINASIIEMMKLESDSIEQKDEYVIQTGQLVNGRRYLKPKDLPRPLTLGCYATPVSIWCTVPRNIKQNFWKEAKRFGDEMKNRLDQKAPLEEEIYRTSIAKEDDLDIFLLDDPDVIFNMTYATSNMGNLAKLFPGEGEFVQATYLNRVTNVHKVYSVHEMHTFRGRLLYAFDYNALYLPKQKAQLWADTIINIINEMVGNYT